jgi:hypothetical protein
MSSGYSLAVFGNCFTGLGAAGGGTGFTACAI